MPSYPITPDIGAIIERSKLEGNVLKLPGGQLDRSTYLDVAKTLGRMGGKWDRRVQGFVFAEVGLVDTLEERIAKALSDGFTEPWKPGYFPTPAGLARRVIELAELDPGHIVLEPSAGTGALAEPAAEVVSKDNVACIELDLSMVLVLREKGYRVLHKDFMKTSPVGIGKSGLDGFDRVVMNPPFEEKKEIDHVRHAFDLLRPGGRLVSIMSLGVTFRTDKKTAALRELILKRGGRIETNPPDAFKKSGTTVNTITVVMDKS